MNAVSKFALTKIEKEKVITRIMNGMKLLKKVAMRDENISGIL